MAVAGEERKREKKKSEPRRLGREECLVGVKDKNNELAAKKNMSREETQYENREGKKKNDVTENTLSHK